MTQTESVAFWISFISGIVGIVLSVVAIVFSILVDRRSSTISDKTIQSLQKIESAVERSSSDTRELIKAAWDKMLVQVDADKDTTPPGEESSAKQMAAGIAAELRSEFADLFSKAATSEQVKKEQLEQYLREFEQGLSAQLAESKAGLQKAGELSLAMERVRGLDERAFALLRAVRRYHLRQDQYKRLLQGPFGEALAALRRHGLIGPVVHQTDHGPEPCYYMPPGASKAIREAVLLLPKPSPEMEGQVNAELKKVGYRGAYEADA